MDPAWGVGHRSCRPARAARFPRLTPRTARVTRGENCRRAVGESCFPRAPSDDVQTTARRLYDLLVELAARSVGVRTRALSRASGAKSLSAPLDRPPSTIRGALWVSTAGIGYQTSQHRRQAPHVPPCVRWVSPGRGHACPPLHPAAGTAGEGAVCRSTPAESRLAVARCPSWTESWETPPRPASAGEPRQGRAQARQAHGRRARAGVLTSRLGVPTL